MWVTAEVPELDRTSFEALVADHVPAVRLSRFAGPEEVEASVAAFDAARSTATDEGGVTRTGLSQYFHGVRRTKEEYLRRAAELHSRREASGAGFDPLERFMDRLAGLGLDVELMAEPDGRRYWAGNWKQRSGTTEPHVDFAPQDSAGWAVAGSVAQLAWNLYLANRCGGALQIWDRHWAPHHAALATTDEYVFAPEVVAGAPTVVLPVAIGDVVIFNSGHYHSVRDASDRLAFGSFISLFEDGRVRLWS